jgi:hypothetical protein
LCVAEIYINDKFNNNIMALAMTFLQEPTPLPLPSFEKLNLDEVEQA